MLAVLPAGPVGVLVWLIVVAAIVIIAYKVLLAIGVKVPPVVVEVFWILVIVAVGVWAILFLASLLGVPTL